MENNIVDISCARDERQLVEFDNRMRWEVSLYLYRCEWWFVPEVIDFITSLIYTHPTEFRNEKEHFMAEAVEFNRRFEKERDDREDREKKRVRNLNQNSPIST